ncbi:hypothetical protein [Rothia nasimurium]|nr:hypothetical protein [Rothia nasimurium]
MIHASPVPADAAHACQPQPAGSQRVRTSSSASQPQPADAAHA